MVMNAQPGNGDVEEEIGEIESPANAKSVWQNTATMTIVSLVVNVVLFFIGRAAGWIPEDMPQSTETFSLVSVIAASVVPVVILGAIMVYLGTHVPRATRLFTMILMIVVVIAIVVPWILQDIDNSFRVLLTAMHLVTAACALALIRNIPQ